MYTAGSGSIRELVLDVKLETAMYELSLVQGPSSLTSLFATPLPPRGRGRPGNEAGMS